MSEMNLKPSPTGRSESVRHERPGGKQAVRALEAHFLHATRHSSGVGSVGDTASDDKHADGSSH